MNGPIKRTPWLLRMFGYPEFRRWEPWRDYCPKLITGTDGCWEYADDPEDFDE